jgi:hypothetical protein
MNLDRRIVRGLELTGSSNGSKGKIDPEAPSPADSLGKDTSKKRSNHRRNHEDNTAD